MTIFLKTAPMGLFYPEAFKPLACEIFEKESHNTKENNYNSYYFNYTEAEDVFDDPYLLEVSNLKCFSLV